MGGPLSEIAAPLFTERDEEASDLLRPPSIAWMDGGIELDYFDGCDDCHAGAASRFPRRV